jgi:hypothetical protein
VYTSKYFCIAFAKVVTGKAVAAITAPRFSLATTIYFVYKRFWERDHLENIGAGGKIILKRILKKWDGVWTGLNWLKIGTRWRALVNAVIYCKSPGSIKCVKFLH